MPSRAFLTLILAFLIPFQASGKDLRRYGDGISCDRQRAVLTFLADDLCRGRECGELGSHIAASFIHSQFRGMGLQPLKWRMIQSFVINDTSVVRNIFAMVPALLPSDRYIVVSAHYDHIGTIRNTIYNGADDNASGVTLMLSLAEAFAQMRTEGAGPDKNIIFAAFDGHEKNMCGSRWFVDHLDKLGISPKQIECNVNIDIIGTDLEPVGKNREYIICLGENTLPDRYHGLVWNCARNPLCRMDVDMTFYGSRNFTEFVYNSGDQYSFKEKNIPAVLFTSGFNKYTLKATDDSDIIDFELLRKRTLLIFNFICALCK